MSKIIDKYLEQEFTDKTKKYYRNLLERFEKHINEKGKNMHTVEDHDVQEYYNFKLTMGEWTSGGSISTFMIVFQKFCKWMLEETDVLMIGKRGADLDKILHERVRITKITRMRKPKTLQKIKTARPVFLPDIKKIFRLMIQDPIDRKHHNFMRMWCLDWFGCRVGELVKIKPEMITLDNNSIYFNTEKTQIQRMNYYDDFTKEILEKYIDDNALINITEQGMWKCLNSYSKQFGQRLNTKLGRQSFNTNMDALKDDPKINKHMQKKYGVTIDERFVKIISGHTISGLGDMTMRYKHYPEQMIKEVMIDYHYLKPLEREIRRLLDK